MARSERLVIQVSPEMKARIERIVKGRDITVSAYCANAIGKAVQMDELEIEYRKLLAERLSGADILK